MSELVPVVHDESPISDPWLRPLHNAPERTSKPVAKRAPNALERGASEAAEREAHLRRLAYIKGAGWELKPEGWVLDTYDTRWSKSSREIVPYDENVSFEEGVRSAFNRQRAIEFMELAAEQRRKQSGGRRAP